MARPRRRPPLDAPAARIQPVPGPSRAAPEVARINATLQDIRRLIDTGPAGVIEEDAEGFLSRRFGPGQAPFADFGRTTVAFEVLPPISPLVPYRPAASHVPPVFEEPIRAVVQAPLRLTLASVLAGWGQWILWRLQAPRIPSPAEREAASRRAPAAAAEPAPLSAAVPAPSPAPAPAADPAPSQADCTDAQPAADVRKVTPQPCPDEAAERAVRRLLDQGSLRQHLNQMIQEELQGEMGARFSSNIRAVIRREVATAMDDRL
ncbi:hypothetical protein [Paracoccus beibuensis]|uniref:hypothetical protein n=1 Tax=Paracoccus beibuensis TaxID=547602 RepID=UPI00223F0B13|nr:hypothetical protein [Paracoccus beibuensis]